MSELLEVLFFKKKELNGMQKLKINISKLVTSIST